MTRFKFIALSFTVALAASTTRVQDQDDHQPVIQKLVTAVDKANAEAAARKVVRETAEDVEVFRRILGRTLNPLYRSRKAASAVPTAYNLTSVEVSEFPVWNVYNANIETGAGGRSFPLSDPVHGVYIDGVGMVFQLELPPPRAEQRPSASDEPKQTEACPFFSLPLRKRTQFEVRGEIGKFKCSRCHSKLEETKLPHALTAVDCRTCHTGVEKLLTPPSKQQKQSKPKPGVESSGLNDLNSRDFSFYIGFKRGPHSTNNSAQAARPTRQELTERLIGLLDENSDGFRHLRSDETVAIAITFREPTGNHESQPRKSNAKSGKSRTNGSTSFGGSGMAAEMMEGMSRGGGSSGFGGRGFGGVFGSGDEMEMMGAMESQSDEVSGDLYLRRKEWANAVKAYTRAIAAHGDKSPTQIIEENLRQLASVSSLKHDDFQLYRKLAQAFIAAGNVNDATIVLKKIQQLRDMVDSGSGISRAAGGRPLAAQLIVTVKGKQLAARAGKKLNSREFLATAGVRYINPNAESGAIASSESIDPTVRGVVTAKLQVTLGDKGDQCVEISIGADDGITNGVILDVWKKDHKESIGEIEVVYLTPDRAIARIRSGKADEGDAVATKHSSKPDESADDPIQPSTRNKK